MADWNHETYCRLYKRTDSRWARLPLFVRALGTELLRHVDDDGCLFGAPGEEAWEAVARIAQAHPSERDAIRAAVTLLTADNGPHDPPFVVLTVTRVVTETVTPSVTDGVTPSRSDRDADRDGMRDASRSVTLTVRNYRAAQGVAETPEERRETRSKEAARAAAYRKRKRDEMDSDRDGRRDGERDASASHASAPPRARVAGRAGGDARPSLPSVPYVPNSSSSTRDASRSEPEVAPPPTTTPLGGPDTVGLTTVVAFDPTVDDEPFLEDDELETDEMFCRAEMRRVRMLAVNLDEVNRLAARFVAPGGRDPFAPQPKAAPIVHEVVNELRVMLADPTEKPRSVSTVFKYLKNTVLGRLQQHLNRDRREVAYG